MSETFNRVVGIVIGVVLFVQSILSILIWRERHHPLIKIRSAPLYFINLWLGVLFVGTLVCLFYALYPALPCEITFWAVFMTHAFYTLPYVLRAVKFLYLFRTTQQRVKQRSKLGTMLSPSKGAVFSAIGVVEPQQLAPGNEEKKPALTKNRAWLVSDKYLVIIWAPLAFLHLLIAAILNIKYASSFHQCQRVTASFAIAAALSLGYIIVVGFLVHFLKTARDAYFLKEEAKAVSIIWLIFALLWAIWEIAKIKSFPGYVWPMIGMAICYFVTGFWVYLQIRRDRYFMGSGHIQLSVTGSSESTMSSSSDSLDESGGSISVSVGGNSGVSGVSGNIGGGNSGGSKVAPFNTVGRLRDLLRDPQFKIAFHDFLVLQFCIENLLFMESVEEWIKERRYDDAKLIFHQFLEEGAPDQVNINNAMGKRIIARMNTADNNKPLDEDLFEEVYDEIEKLLENDSLTRFRSNLSKAATSLVLF